MEYTKYKFKDICMKKGFIRGPFGSALKKSLFVPKGEDTYKVYEQCVPLEQNKYGGHYYITGEYFRNSLSRFEVRHNDFLVSCSGVNYGAIYHLQEPFEKGVINQALLIIRIDETIVDYSYFKYLFRVVLSKAITTGTGDSTIPNFPSMDVIKDIDVYLPTLETQKKVGQILNDIENKIQANNRINDNLQQQMFTIYETMMVGAEKKKIPGRNITAKEITEVITGKEDANFSTSGGEYKFFTCSTTPLKCDEAAFDSASILIAGNGDFNVKHYTGKFNAYQRTYVLTPPDKYYAILYLASLYRINSFKSASAGSIVKFITKGDVENIPLFIPDNELYLQQLNSLVRLQEQMSTENEKLISLRDWLLPMLMNGQATISD